MNDLPWIAKFPKKKSSRFSAQSRVNDLPSIFKKKNILSIEPRVVNDTLNREQKGNGKSLR